jgi:Putative mono-oxygenase ydhR
MITAIVLYDLPSGIGLEECRTHFTTIAPSFLQIAGFVRKQFICSSDGKTAGGVYMWKDRASAERFYNGPWRQGIIERYGNPPRIQFFETVALADAATAFAGALSASGSRQQPALAK